MSDPLCTPTPYVEAVRKVFGGIDLDPCGREGQTPIAGRAIYKKEDGLTADWHGRAFVNPPWGYDFYEGDGDVMVPWLKRCHDAGMEWMHKDLTEAVIAVAYLPAYPNAPWFQKYVLDSADAICWVRQPSLARFKLRTGQTTDSLPVCFALFGLEAYKLKTEFKQAFRQFGWCTEVHSL